MQWKEFKRIVEEELGIKDETELWKIDINLPLASEFMRVEQDSLLGVSLTTDGLSTIVIAEDVYQAAA
jgi:hypothetical protein